MGIAVANAPVRARRISFEIPIVNDEFNDDFYNEFNQMHLKKAIYDLNIGKGEVHELIEVE